MKINPTTLKWTAPTQDTDGKPITLAMEYELSADGIPRASFPGTLNPDGSYQAPLADMGFDPGNYSLTLTAFYKDKPELKSPPSNAVEAMFGVAPPGAPTLTGFLFASAPP